MAKAMIWDISYLIDQALEKSMRKGSQFGKWYYGISLFNRYGLYSDDMLNECINPEVAEALRRVPKDVYDRRVYRQVRADQLEINKMYLPKDQWIKCEDPMNWYLQPYIDEVMAEWNEKSDWEKKHPQ